MKRNVTSALAYPRLSTLENRMNGLKSRIMSYQQREEHKLHVPVGHEIDKIVR